MVRKYCGEVIIKVKSISYFNLDSRFLFNRIIGVVLYNKERCILVLFVRVEIEIILKFYYIFVLYKLFFILSDLLFYECGILWRKCSFSINKYLVSFFINVLWYFF